MKTDCVDPNCDGWISMKTGRCGKCGKTDKG